LRCVSTRCARWPTTEAVKAGSVVFLGLLGALLSWSYGFAQEDIMLTLRSGQADYVTREPVKIVVDLKNVSGTIVRIPEVEYLGINMEFMYYEIGYPDGRHRYRHFRSLDVFGVKNPEYIGEPLEPDGEIEMLLYPNVTYPIKDRRAGEHDEITFSRPGDYQVTVYYDVPAYWKKLWRPRFGAVRSNTILLHFREPTAEENEILNAIWSLGLVGPAMGDSQYELFDEAALKRVIDMYPLNPMIKHAKLALAKSYLCQLDDRNSQLAAVQILEGVIDEYPEFRFEEVRQHLGTALWRSGDHQKSAEVFNETLHSRPPLKDNFEFMSVRLAAIYGPGEPLREWKRCRVSGERFDESKFSAMHAE
jgi:hypothetical protein